MLDRRFDDFLRRGGETPQFETLPGERKFNPYHDPDDGRFTFAPGGGSLAPRVGSADSVGMANRVRNPPVGPGRPRIPTQLRSATATSARTSDHGGLSARYESAAGGNPGMVSAGTNDPGGVSYGSYQLASKTGTAAAFVASPEARGWAVEFRGLIPGSSAFSDKWRQVAVKEPKSFHLAQKSYIDRTHYGLAAKLIASRTSLDVTGRSEALRQVTYSTAVQHGANGGAGIISNAVGQIDKLYRRSDPRYDRAFINKIYDLRIERVLRLRDVLKSRKQFGKANELDNVVKNRFPDERKRALAMLPGG